MYNRKKRLFLTAVCLSLGLLTGCNVGNTKNYKQAAQDLEQGNYEAALEEYETAISEGVKPAQTPVQRKAYRLPCHSILHSSLL